MIMLILTIHLALAAIYTLSIIGLTIAAALRKSLPALQTSTIASFALTIGSGAALVIVSPEAMTQFCTSTLMASAFGVAAWLIYKHRVAAFKSEESTLY